MRLHPFLLFFIFSCTLVYFASVPLIDAQECALRQNATLVQQYLTCDNGGSLNCSATNATICQCSNDFTGPRCKRCNSNSACRNASDPATNDFVCDVGPYARTYKNYQCTTRDQDSFTLFLIRDLNAIFEIDVRPNGDAGTAFVQGWTSGTGYPSMFQCSLSACSSTFETIDGKQRFKYNCKTSSCGCTEEPQNFCNPLVPPAFAEIKGLTEFVFDETTDNIIATTITPRDLDALQGKLALVCRSGECGTPFQPPTVATTQPDNVGTIVPIIVIPAAIIGLAIVPILAYACLVSCGRSSVSSLYPLGSVGESPRQSKLKLNGVTLTLKGVSYFVERSTSIWPWGKTEKMQILHDINCEIRPGRLTAILGASGAGKTTTLDIIAGYDKLGKVKGEILLNGQTLPSSYRYMVGYVLQEDRMIGTLTVEEHLMYTALLRLPESVSHVEKKQIVNDLIEEFGLDKVRSNLIGDDAARGISSGEMRRVSIASELITKPRVLICDEPTSGLDAYNALSVMQALKRVAERGCTVIASIHQPRSSIFYICDDALVLWNGKTVYSGRTKSCIKFLSKHGFECPDDFNVADFIIDAVTLEDPEKVERLVDSTRKAAFKKAERFEMDKPDPEEGVKSSASSRRSSKESLSSRSSQSEMKFMEAVLESQSGFATNWLTQLAVLSHRSMKNLFRKKTLFLTHAIAYIAIAIFIGLAYLRAEVTIQGIQNRAGSLFFQVALFSFAAISSIDMLLSERPVFVRERGNHAYRTSAYFLAKVFTDIVPLRIVLPIIYCFIVYWMIGYQSGGLNFLRFLIVVLLINVVSASFMLMLSASVRTVASGTVIAVLVLLLMLLFGGLFLNVESSPPWINWIKYLSWMLYSYEALVTNEMFGLKVRVSLEGVDRVEVDGNIFLTQFGFNYANFGRDVAILAGFTAAYLLIAYIVLRLFVKYRQ